MGREIMLLHSRWEGNPMLTPVTFLSAEQVRTLASEGGQQGWMGYEALKALKILDARRDGALRLLDAYGKYPSVSRNDIDQAFFYAEVYSPKRTYKEARQRLSRYVNCPREAVVDYARGARDLARIRRDEGEDAFNEVVGQIKIEIDRVDDQAAIDPAEVSYTGE